jgi:hypothetical protein
MQLDNGKSERHTRPSTVPSIAQDVTLQQNSARNPSTNGRVQALGTLRVRNSYPRSVCRCLDFVNFFLPALAHPNVAILLCREGLRLIA